MPDRLTDFLFRPRRLALLLAVAFALGAAHALAMLPVPLVLGEAAGFWAFPRGTIPGGIVDMGQELMGYRYLAAAPWTLPLLQVPNLVPPAGTNAFWLDPVPAAALLGRLAAGPAGGPVNLLGGFLFLCFALPGVAMTGLFWAAGARGLLAAIVAALLTDCMPLLLFEWGHIALCAQFLIVLALALVVAGQRGPRGWRLPLAWLALLAASLLTHLYLFVMVGGCWTAGLLQAGLAPPGPERRAPRARLAAEAALTVALVLALGVASGIVSRDVRSGGTSGYGEFSLNLGSPWVPQLSGAIPPLRHYWIGMRSQVLNYPGLGVLLVLLAGLAVAIRQRAWAGSGLRGYAPLVAVLLGFTAFAVSNRVTLGARVLLDIPLPDGLAYALGAFRASGRFFWPVSYAMTAAAALVLLQRAPRRPALAILAVACALQVIDAGPLRAAIAASAGHAQPAVLDREAAAAIVAEATAVSMFPTTGCVHQALVEDGAIAEAQTATAPATGPATATAMAPTQAELRVLQATVELQLLASRRNLPLNSVVNSRIATDCAAERAERGRPLRPGEAYFYLVGAGPDAARLGGRDPDAACTSLGWVRACRVAE